MDQNAAALAHYYHLRSQDVSPAEARSHVRQRFGVDIVGDVPSPDEATRPAAIQESPGEYGGEFCETITGTSTGPQYGMPVPSHNGRPDCEWCEGDYAFCDGSECEK